MTFDLPGGCRLASAWEHVQKYRTSASQENAWQGEQISPALHGAAEEVGEQAPGAGAWPFTLQVSWHVI